MNPKIIGVVLLIFGLGAALYFYNSGGTHKLGSIIPASSSSQASASSSFFSFFSLFGSHTSTSPASISGSSSYPGYGAQAGSSQGSATSGIPSYEIPKGYTAAQLSPWFGKIRLGGVGTQEISLYASAPEPDTSSTLDITGWEIRTNRGGLFVPQAVNIYNPESANPESDIVLPLWKYDYIYLYSNSAPTNVRLNKCMGYLNAANQFHPSFPYGCPSVDRSQISQFTGQCQNYILSLGCNAPNLSNPAVRNDYYCQQYLQNNFTYNSCISNHAYDSDFLSTTWYVWTGSTPIDPYHDNVALLDRNGLIVDTYSY